MTKFVYLKLDLAPQHVTNSKELLPDIIVNKVSNSYSNINNEIDGN